MSKYTERVKRGAALLDKVRPGWRNTIDLSTLDLSSGCLCILGQVFKHYDCGLYAVWNIDMDKYDSLEEWTASDGFKTAIAHGFTIDYTRGFALAPSYKDYDEGDEWDALQEAWVAELSTEEAYL
jgi:hypothetical protein